jgi:hypothetical protein
MKRLSGLMLAVAIVLGATPGYAQVSGGVLGGVNFSKASISGEDATGIDTEFQTGLIVGGFFNLPVSSTVSIMPEVAYSQKHSKLVFSEDGDEFSQKLAVDFLSIPVLFKFGAQEGGFYVVAGPGLNFRTKAEARDAEVNGEEFPDADEDLDDETESFDFSLIGGLGWARGNFGFEGRYDHGLTNLNKDEEEDFEIKSRAFTFVVKIWFK